MSNKDRKVKFCLARINLISKLLKFDCKNQQHIGAIRNNYQDVGVRSTKIFNIISARARAALKRPVISSLPDSRHQWLLSPNCQKQCALSDNTIYCERGQRTWPATSQTSSAVITAFRWSQ